MSARRQAGGMTSRIPPKLRALIIDFPDDARRGAVQQFCSLHGVSVASFYRIKAMAAEQGPEAAAAPLSTAPKHRPARTEKQVEDEALAIRADLDAAGWSSGPLSVAAVMRRQGQAPPSRATLARIFCRRGVVEPEPSKKPRAAYQRFRYPQPNSCWQMDGMYYKLDNGQTWCILHVLDDHASAAMASLICKHETSNSAIEVTSIGFRRHGIPQRMLTDNALAFNQSRRGAESEFEKFLKRHGVTPITGRPGKPTTQGKVERLHRTVQKYLDAHRPIYTVERLRELVDQFDDYYNNHRPHQALDTSIDQTPAQAYQATPKAQPPSTPITRSPVHQWATPKPIERHKLTNAEPVPGSPGVFHATRIVGTNSEIAICAIYIRVNNTLIGQTLDVLIDDTTITVIGPGGEILGDVPRPAPDLPGNPRYTLTHRGVGRPRKPRNPPKPEFTHELPNET